MHRGASLFLMVVGMLFANAAHAQFATVINSPPEAIGDDEIALSGTQVNVLADGVVGISFSAGEPSGASENIEVNISGGSVGNRFEAFGGSTVNISGGTVGPFFDANVGSVVSVSGGIVGEGLDAFAGSSVDISGGSVGNGFEAGRGSNVRVSGGSIGDGFVVVEGSAVTIVGGEFRIDDALVDLIDGEALVDVPPNRTFSGTFADGTPFAFSGFDGDVIGNGALLLRTVSLPEIGPSLIDAAIDPVPAGIRSGQELVVGGGGAVRDHFAAGRGSRIRVEQGGLVGANFEAVGSEVTIQGGSVGRDFDAFMGSDVTISGGEVGDGFDALMGSQVTLSGGRLGSDFSAMTGSDVTISGGSLGDGFVASSDSVVTISGGDFRIDGSPVAGIVDVPETASLTGTLADGTPFAFSRNDGEMFATGTLTLADVDLPAVGPAQIVAATDAVPAGIRAGQELIVGNGGAVGDGFSAGWGSHVQIEQGGTVGANFEAVGTVQISGGEVGLNMDALGGSNVTISGGSVGDGMDANNNSTVNISGGDVGDEFRAFASRVNIQNGSIGDHMDANFGSDVSVSGGEVGAFFDANNGSRITISGGSVGTRFDANLGSIVRITGGAVADRLNAKAGSNVTISGGRVGNRIEAGGGSTMQVSGGAIGDRFRAFSESAVSIVGGDFRLDGVPTQATGPLEIPTGVTFSGTMADGTPFAFSSDDLDAFSAGTLTLLGTELPPIGPDAITVSTEDLSLLGIRSGQTLIVDDGGVVGDHFGAGWGSTVRVESGGAVGMNLEAVGAIVNVTGGTVGRDFDAFAGSEVTISGGSVGDGVDANKGSVVRISGGAVGSGFDANTGSDVTISGGFVDEDFDSRGGSNVTIVGGDFRLDGVPLAPGPIDVPENASLSGTLTDGRPFLFTSRDSDQFANGTLALEESDLPPVGPMLITVPADGVPTGIRQGQSMVVGDGGVVGDHFGSGWGGTVTVQPGGTIGADFEAVGSTVTVDGGSIGEGFDAASGSTLKLLAGSIGDEFDASNGSVVSISGGSVGDQSSANTGSLVELNGGSLGNEFEVNTGAELVVADGTVGDELRVNTSVLTVSGGAIGPNAVASGDSVVNIDGGVVGDGFDALNGTTVTIRGGTVGNQLDAFNGSTVAIRGGSVGPGFDANTGSTVTISGGEIGGDIDAFSGSVVNISGGTLGEGFDANSGSTVNLYGTEFTIDGLSIEGLDDPGDSFVVNARDGETLSATLQDDEVLDFTLWGRRTLGDFFSPGATLRLFLVESLGVCDFDDDGFCNVGDVDALVAEIASGNGASSFDLNSDGMVDGDDLTIWLENAADKNGLGESYLLGDANLDGTVDASDLNKMALNWSQDVTGWSAGDFTADGTVGPADLNVVGLNWQKSSLPPQPSSVPEPNSRMLVVIGLLADLTRRRRRAATNF